MVSTLARQEQLQLPFIEDRVRNLALKISQQREFIRELTTEVLNWEIELREICDHEDVSTERKYFSGSYNDCAETIVTTTCKTCGTVVGQETIRHNWYG